MDPMAKFCSMFGGTLFWNGVNTLSGQASAPDPFEAPWESTGTPPAHGRDLLTNPA